MQKLMPIPAKGSQKAPVSGVGEGGASGTSQLEGRGNVCKNGMKVIK